MIFHSTFVSVWGCILCPKIVFKSITGAICILIHPLGKVGREEGCSPPHLLAVKVGCGVIRRGPAAQSQAAGAWETPEPRLGVCSSPLSLFLAWIRRGCTEQLPTKKWSLSAI